MVPVDHAKNLSKMGHDIRSPLHVIKGLSDILSASQHLLPSEKNMAAMIRTNAIKLNELVEELIAYAQSPGSTPAKPAAESHNHLQLVPPKTLRDKKKRVLLVEDHPANARVAIAYLEQLGYSCDHAETGQEALSKFSTYCYDAILMDVQMQGMDGIETTKHIRALERASGAPPTTIIATTGNATEDDHLICRRAGMNGCLSKPFDVKDLERKLQFTTR